ncbi:MAG: hypothetical protein M1822_009087 [Bathelium mastoideum]|nr:MAG: hypothetical protein M1822_009087 [Bathelium mastoideum]
MSHKRSRSVSTDSTSTSDAGTPRSDSQDLDGAPIKYVQLDDKPSASKHADSIVCQLPPHDHLHLSSIGDFETHYQKEHVHRCIECHKNLPSDHFLGLHISENHDPLSEIRRERGEKTNYDFFIVNDGIDNRTTMLRLEPTSKSPIVKHGPKPSPMLRRKAKAPAGGAKAPEKETADMNDITNSMNALQFVPPSVRNARTRNEKDS